MIHHPFQPGRTLPGHTVFFRGGGERLVPSRDALGTGGHGQRHRAGLPGSTSRAAALLAEARLPRVGFPAGANVDLLEDAGLRLEHFAVGHQRGIAASELGNREINPDKNIFN